MLALGVAPASEEDVLVQVVFEYNKVELEQSSLDGGFNMHISKSHLHMGLEVPCVVVYRRT